MVAMATSFEKSEKEAQMDEIHARNKSTTNRTDEVSPLVCMCSIASVDCRKCEQQRSAVDGIVDLI